jgi:predicted phosphate transport protein (TIGR00153 family)
VSNKNYFSSIFGKSPVKPLQEHMARVMAAADELVPFFEGVIANDWEAARAARERVIQFEHDADAMKKDMRLNMPNSLFMPVARADILDLISMQDRIANQAKDITGIMTGRRMALPKQLADAFLTFVKRALDAVHQARRTVGELDELFETGFRGAEVQTVQGMIAELDHIERDTDRIEIELRGALFAIEKELPPIDVVFYYQIIDDIGELADLSHRVGSRLELLLAH